MNIRTEIEMKQSLLSSLASDSIDERPDPPPLSELERHQLTLTPEEIKIGQMTAVGSGLGNAGLISSAWLFAITPWEQVGLGLSLGAAASISMLAVISVTTILLTIPLSYYAYNDYMIETKALEQAIQDKENARTKNREDLFFQCLELKCTLEENEFKRFAESPSGESDETTKKELITLVNSVYNNAKFDQKRYAFNNNGELIDAKQENSNSLKFLFSKPKLAQNSDFRQSALNEFKKFDHHFTQKFEACFKPIEPLPTFYAKPFAYGATGAIMFSATLFGTYWTFAGILVGAAICASIPMIGWATLAIACIIASIYLGVWVGKAKNKNMQREELEKGLANRNTLLDNSKNEVANVLKNDFLREMNLHPQPAIMHDAKIQPQKDEKLTITSPAPAPAPTPHHSLVLFKPAPAKPSDSKINLAKKIRRKSF